MKIGFVYGAVQDVWGMFMHHKVWDTIRPGIRDEIWGYFDNFGLLGLGDAIDRSYFQDPNPLAFAQIPLEYEGIRNFR